MFKFNAYKTVHPTVHATGDSPIDFAALQEQDQKQVQMEHARIHNKAVEKEFIEKQKRQQVQENTFAQVASEDVKLNALGYLDKHLGDQLFAEAFTSIYIRSLPHDQDFIAEHYLALEKMAQMYCRKLGGLNYLKARCEATGSPYLKKLYEVIETAKKNISKKTAKKVINTLTDKEAMDLVKGGISDEDRQELLRKINELGSDELTELIKNKVVDVVKDEHQREKEDREFRTALKNDMDDSIDITGKTLGDGKDANGEDLTDDDGRIDTGDQPEDLDTIDGTSAPDDAGKPDKETKGHKFEPKKPEKKEPKKPEKEEKKLDKDLTDGSDKMKSDKKEKDEDKKKDKLPKTELEGYSVRELMDHWDPVHEDFTYDKNMQPKSLLYAIATSVARDMMKSAVATEGASVTKDMTKHNSYVIENPLNMDVFNAYMKDNSDGITDMELSHIHEPKVLGSSNEKPIDPDQIMTEALIQYTLLEAAYTMKLIDPSAKELRDQTNYLLGIA